MELICINCGNFTYFEIEVESFKAIEPGTDGIIIDNYCVDEIDYTDDSIRSNLYDTIDHVLKHPDNCLQFDQYNHEYTNSFLICARCNSRKVVTPYSEWNPKALFKSLEEELNENRNEYLTLRKEVHCENKLLLR